jgi:hypothetical protein
MLYNFLSFDKTDSNNFEVNNIVLSAMSSIFVVFNSYLYCRLVESMRLKVLVSFGTMFLLLASLFGSNYHWQYARIFDVIFLFIYSSIGFTLVLIFGYIQTNISKELVKEA